MKKARVIIGILFLAFILIGTGYFIYNRSKPKTTVYKTTNAFIANIEKKSVATGAIVPRKEVNIVPQVSGIIEKIYVKSGETVIRGQKLAKIKLVPDPKSINTAETSLAFARINFDKSKSEYERQQKLFNEGIISQSAFEGFTADYQIKATELESAKNNLELIREGAAKNLREVSNIITATLNGMVLDIPVQEGGSVIERNSFNDGSTVITLADMNSLLFIGSIGESDVNNLQENMSIELTIGAIPNSKFNAILEYIAPKGVEEDGTIKFAIHAAINIDPDVRIRAGYSATADIVLDKRDSVLAMKERDILFSGDSVFVEIRMESKDFEKRVIKTGLSDGINIEILEGLIATDNIKVQETVEDEEEKNDDKKKNK